MPNATGAMHLIKAALASELVSGNVVTWALSDHQGTVRDMVRYASGTTTIVNHRKYDAFGNLTAESDAIVKFLFSYTGREWDGDAGLYYYRARWYDAKLGRFILEDPIGFAAGDTNLNRYVGNSSPKGKTQVPCTRQRKLWDAGSLHVRQPWSSADGQQFRNDKYPTTVQTNVYDANSRRTQQTATVSGTADYKNTWTWDNANRQTQVKQEGQSGGNTVAAKRVDFTYNTGGMFTGIKRYNDLAGTQVVANTTFTYDQLARLTALDHKNATGGNLANYTWTFDADRRITNFTNPDGSSAFSYDTNDQVTVVDHSYQTDESYTYSANGNRTNTGYTTSTNNQVTSDGTYNYTYDDEGNRISRTKISDSTKIEYTWDHRNRLTDVVFKNASGTVTKKIQYKYDVFNRRIGRKMDATGDGTYETATYWVYDDAGKRDPNTGTPLDDIVLEFTDADGDGSGAATLSTRYLHGPQFDQVLASETVSGNVVSWALADHQGTVRDMARYASGTTTIVNHRKFDAFGNLTAESDSTVKFLFSYTGREWDGDAGLYYYRARWYDPKMGRFVSEDPMGFAAGDTNVSRYVGNSPTVRTDPTGLWSYEAHLKILNEFFRRRWSDDNFTLEHRIDMAREGRNMDVNDTLFNANNAAHYMIDKRPPSDLITDDFYYTKEHARRTAGELVRDELEKAHVIMQRVGATTDARLIEEMQEQRRLHLARAFHTVMDSTSPPRPQNLWVAID